MVLICKYPRKEALAHYWPLSEAFIEQGLRPGQGEVNISHVWAELEAERAQLIVGVDRHDCVHAALVVQFINMPNYRIAHVLSVGGRGVVENKVHWEGIKAWMKANGATKIQGMCRPAQARLWRKLGFESVYEVVRQDL